MLDSPHKIALLYDDDAYRETTRGQRLPLPNDQPAGLMGRQVAGREFLKAYLDHGAWTELVALVRNQQSVESLKHLWRDKPWSPQSRRLRIVDERSFHEGFLRDPPARVLHLPCPPDSRYAWARHASAPGAFALCGVTHTLCSLDAARQLCDYVTAPFQPFDTLVCTSTAVVSMVRAVTDSYADYLRDHMGGRPALGLRLAHIPLGVDTGKYRPASREERSQQRAALGITEEEVAVLFVGRLSHHAKAHPFPMFDGLAAAARQAGQAVHLILAGWAANSGVQAAFVEGARLFAPGVKVTFVDGEDPGQRFAVWRAADIFSSLSDNIQETFGLVIVEAMACGLPVVASDWDGYRDLVVDGQTGFLVPTAMVVGATRQTTSRLILGEINYDHFLAENSQATVVDPVAAATAYSQLLSDPERRRSLGDAGRRRALEHFTWSRIIQRYEVLWSEQEAHRREFLTHREAVSIPGGPSLYPEPESSFRGYPTTWLDAGDQLGSEPDASQRLDMFLAAPLTNHEAGRRVSDQVILASILAVAAEGRSIVDLDEVLSHAGIDHRAGRATLAWLLKYGLLRRSDKTLPRDSASADLGQVVTASASSAGMHAGPSAKVHRLCFVTVCMGRLDDLRQTLGQLTAQSGCSVVVVDYACPERTGDWVAVNHPEVRVLRVQDRTELNRSEARNRGASISDSPWLCFIDADILINPDFAGFLLPRLERGFYYCAGSFAEGTEGTFACAREDFERAGGFDEVLLGWGEEDNDLYDALEFIGVRKATFPVSLLHHLPHGDEPRARFHSLDPRLSHAINRVYRILKWDTAKLRGRPLTLAMRQNLYRTVRQIVTAAMEQDRPGDLSVKLPYGIVPEGWRLPRSLVYQLVKDPAFERPEPASRDGAD